ncbi:MAG: hypothetical protein CO140_00820 [Candidatus Moranbacteria bacterium CG_4_9_14_3_um_filter_40_7]|nr:MAG: hypothetical protein CO140_00820 [Candidatus Moranbacteria bacterium CG_4_9_14_3_um_filter_40_7]
MLTKVSQAWAFLSGNETKTKAKNKIPKIFVLKIFLSAFVISVAKLQIYLLIKIFVVLNFRVVKLK